MTSRAILVTSPPRFSSSRFTWIIEYLVGGKVGRITPDGVSDLIWESPTSLLAVSGLTAGSPVYRCDVRSGSCEHLDRPGQPALGNNAQPGG